MKNQLPILIFSLTLTVQCIASANGQQAQISDGPLASSLVAMKTSHRSFEFKYGAKIIDVPNDAMIRVWFPIAETNEQQDVRVSNFSTPSEVQIDRDEKYGNKIGFFEIRSTGQQDMEFSLTLDVTRREASLSDPEIKLSEEQRQVFLSANSLIPINGKPKELIRGTRIPSEPMAVGRILYNIVDRHMSYDKSKPGYGRGDAVWACDSRTGNCTDFHSLFISLARSQSIPARFEIGFPLPTDQSEGVIGGYHCWAWFYAIDQGWLPVDISEADKHPEMKDYYFGRLTADRISFSTGRDIALVPKSENGALNYFVYPVVEVNGKRWPEEKIKSQFSFRDKITS